MTLKRIIMHWSAGGWNPSQSERDHYHEFVDGYGKRHLGMLRPEANISTKDGVYAPHARRLNTGSIGLAVCAMGLAKERPFEAGPYPITPEQLDVFVEMVADYAETYSIPVTRRTVLTHAEVEPTLGVAQRGKWDITWLPGMDKPGDPILVGDKLRAMVLAEMAKGNQPKDHVPARPNRLRRFIQKLRKRF